MGTALSWLNDLAQWLGRWFPRLALIHPTHRGVRFGLAGKSLEVGPGLVLYWPIIHDLVEVPVTTISYQSSAQILHLEEADRGLVPHVAVVAVAVQFKVTDPIKAAVRVLNFHAIVDNRIQAAISRHWKGELDKRDWCAPALKEAAHALEAYGIALEHLDVTQHGRGCALKNIADWGYSDSVEGKRPR